MKKALFKTTAYIFFFFTIIQAAIYAQAADLKPDSHSFETAAEASAGQDIRGRIMTSNDADYYRYTLDEKGFYRFCITLTDKDSSSQFYLSIYDSEKNLLEELAFDVLDITEISGDSCIYSKKYECSKGTVFYLSVTTEQEEDCILNVNTGYLLRCEALRLYDQEQETNDTFSSANTVRNGIDIYGTISENEDTDYYCYTAGKSGKATLVFTCDANNTFGWNIEVYDNSRKKLLSLLEKTAKTRKAVQITGGQKYYIKVYGGETCFHSNEAILDKQYRVNIKI